MRNQPHNELGGSGDTASRSIGVPWDATPDRRLLLLFAMLCLPIAVVAVRLMWLQLTQGEVYAAIWDRLTIIEEVIPARDGRILTADGVVLAEDVTRFDLAMHYRWLEEPADDRWLTQQALARLSRGDRRVRALVESCRQQVLNERELMWDQLARVANISARQLCVARRDVQSRVERIVRSVNERREQRQAQQSQVTRNPDATTGPPPTWLRQMWTNLVRELTTPPHRPQADPVTVQEELDYHIIAANVPLSVVAQIESSPSSFPGVRVLQTTERLYPQADLASHLVGVRTPITPDELLARRELFPDGDPLDYCAGDRIGRDGIERGFEERLRGRRGLRRIVIDRRGQVTAEHVVHPPHHGQDVVLSLDSRLQRQAERLLDESLLTSPAQANVGDEPASPLPSGACFVVLDLWTGDLVTAAAAPRHSLQTLIHPSPDEWEALINDTRRPFFPRVTQMTIPPGSVFKVLTATALLESGGIDPDEPLFCQGYLNRPDRDRCYLYRHYGIGHGHMTLANALCQSCNVYFYQAARAIGPQPIHDWAQRFGFGSPTGIDVPGERRGNLPDPFARPDQGQLPWYPGTTLQFSIGQASLTVTPLQIARMMAAIGNGGYLVTPRLAQPEASRTLPESVAPPSDIRLAGYQSSLPAPVLERIPGLSRTTLERIQEGMRLVVESDRGTGRHARIAGLPLAAKTGTAEVGGGKPDHAWFAGYFPADAPRYAFTIVLEHGGSGGRSAAPMAKTLIETMLEAGFVSRRLPVELEVSGHHFAEERF